jgi:hypothetical protein
MVGKRLPIVAGQLVLKPTSNYIDFPRHPVHMSFFLFALTCLTQACTLPTYPENQRRVFVGPSG